MLRHFVRDPSHMRTYVRDGSYNLPLKDMHGVLILSDQKFDSDAVAADSYSLSCLLMIRTASTITNRHDVKTRHRHMDVVKAAGYSRNTMACPHVMMVRPRKRDDEKPPREKNLGSRISALAVKSWGLALRV